MTTNAIAAGLLAALLTGTAAIAQEGTQDFAGAPASTRTRADVKAELAQARASGQLAQRGETYGGFERAPAGTSRARADVVAELDAARQAGELDARSHSYGLHARHDIKSTKTRDEVRAELVEARAARARLSRGDRSGE
jgi:hypothetical protein